MYVQEREIKKLFPLVHKISSAIHRKIPHLADFDDIFSQGMIGAIKANRRCDPSRDGAITFLSRRIRGSIIDYIRDLCPMSRKEFKILKEYDNSNEYVPEIEALRIKIISDEFLWMEKILESKDTPLDYLMVKERIEIINQRMKKLPERTQRIILLLLQGNTMKEVGEIVNLTESRICQISNHIIIPFFKNCFKDFNYKKEEIKMVESTATPEKDFQVELMRVLYSASEEALPLTTITDELKKVIPDSSKSAINLFLNKYKNILPSYINKEGERKNLKWSLKRRDTQPEAIVQIYKNTLKTKSNSKGKSEKSDKSGKNLKHKFILSLLDSVKKQIETGEFSGDISVTMTEKSLIIKIE